MGDLKPCPFCGSKPKKITKGQSRGRVKCNGQTPDGVNCRIGNLTWPIDTWNTRPEPSGDAVAALELLAESANQAMPVAHEHEVDRAVETIRAALTNACKVQPYRCDQQNGKEPEKGMSIREYERFINGQHDKTHAWDDDGETCLKCGDKDWMNDPICSNSKIDKGQPQEVDAKSALDAFNAVLPACVDAYTPQQVNIIRSALGNLIEVKND